MALDFPPPPLQGAPDQTWTDPNNQVWHWNGDAWVRTKIGSGIPEPTVLATQMSRQVDEAGKAGKWIPTAVDVWYLGAFDSSPLVDNNGDPLVEGHVYLNKMANTMYSWDGKAWRPFAPTYEIFGLTSYTYQLSAPLLSAPLVGPDIYGNTPAGWIEGQTLVTVYRQSPGGTDPDTGGSRLNAEIDGNIPQDFLINYANSQVTPVNVQWENGDKIILQISQIQLGNDASTFPWVIDEDDMVSNTETKVPTQQSVKTYVDVADTQLQENMDALEEHVDLQFEQFQTGIKNLIINGNSQIRQRPYISDWANLPINTYFIDRWYKSAWAPTKKTQVLEYLEGLIDGQTYTVSWDGGGIGDYWNGQSNAITNSGDTGFQIIGKDELYPPRIALPYTAYNIQVEKGVEVTVLEKRSATTELLACQAFYWRMRDETAEMFAVPRNGGGREREGHLLLPVLMRNFISSGFKFSFTGGYSNNFASPPLVDSDGQYVRWYGPASNTTADTWVKGLVIDGDFYD